MFFDQQEYYCVTGMFSFPDFPFGDHPTQPDEVGEKINIKGTVPGGRRLSITGTSDQYGPIG